MPFRSVMKLRRFKEMLLVRGAAQAVLRSAAPCRECGSTGRPRAALSNEGYAAVAQFLATARTGRGRNCITRAALAGGGSSSGSDASSIAFSARRISSTLMITPLSSQRRAGASSTTLSSDAHDAKIARFSVGPRSSHSRTSAGCSRSHFGGSPASCVVRQIENCWMSSDDRSVLITTSSLSNMETRRASLALPAEP